MKTKLKYSEIKLNELESRCYDEYHGCCTDWVTEYNYFSKDDLSLKEFKNVLPTENFCGDIYYRKFKLKFANKEEVFRYNCKVVLY